MTDEEKKAETARLEAEKAEKEKADADFEAEIAELSDEEKETKRAEREAQNTDKKTDYKAIAQQERERREKAEKALADQRYRDAERRRKGQQGDDDDEDDSDEDDEDKPISRKDLRKVISETTQQTEKRLMGSRIKEIADSLADSPEEAEAIIETHKNRTFPEHLSIEEQLEEVHAIVNRKTIVSKNAELKRALKSKGTASDDSTTTHRDSPQAKAKVAPDVEASLKAQKFIYDGTSKLWKKKLPNGKTLCKDTKVSPIKTFII